MPVAPPAQLRHSPIAGQNLAGGHSGLGHDKCAPHVSLPAQGGYKYHQYQVVGRHLPTSRDPEPTIYRMKMWASDPVRAKSKFW